MQITRTIHNEDVTIALTEAEIASAAHAYRKYSYRMTLRAYLRNNDIELSNEEVDEAMRKFLMKKALIEEHDNSLEAAVISVLENRNYDDEDEDEYEEDDDEDYNSDDIF